MIKKGMKKAKQDWIDEQCRDIEESLNRNNSKKAHQIESSQVPDIAKSLPFKTRMEETCQK